MTERELSAYVQQTMVSMSLWGYHPHDSRRDARGWPDWVIIGQHGIIFRELKSAEGRLSPEQREVGWRLRQAGADWAVWRPADLHSGRIVAELSALREPTG